jgi:hypothetical protein
MRMKQRNMTADHDMFRFIDLIDFDILNIINDISRRSNQDGRQNDDSNGSNRNRALICQVDARPIQSKKDE